MEVRLLGLETEFGDFERTSKHFFAGWRWVPNNQHELEVNGYRGNGQNNAIL